MDISSPNKNFKSFLRSQNVATAQPRTGFLENWETALNQTFYEGMSFSQYLVSKPYRKERNKRLMEYVNSGAIPEDEVAGFRGLNGEDLNWHLLAVHAKKKYNLDVLDDDEIKQRVREDLKYPRRHAQEVQERANLPGLIGQFAGTAHASFLDPVLMPGLFVGYGEAAHGARFLNQVAKTALKVGLVEGGLEAGRQIPIAMWKHDIGVDYGVGDAIANIALVTGTAGGIGATAEAIGFGLRRLLTQTKSYDTGTAKRARQVVDQAIDEMSDAPDPTMRATDHAANIEGEVAYHETRGPAKEPDWQDIDFTEASLVEPQMRNVTQAQAPKGDQLTEDVVDAAFDDLTVNTPDAEVPTGEYVEVGGQIQPRMANAKTVVEEHNSLQEMVNKFKECLVHGY